MSRAPRPVARDQLGVALSSTVALVSAGAVVLAAVAFVLTGGVRGDRPAQAAVPTHAAASSSSAPAPATARTPAGRAKEKPHRPRPVRRGEVYVVVFNNSGISGLAGSTAARAQGAGWQVVGSDNWYGTIDASTVYYPPQLKRAAVLLAADLDVARVKPAIDPMSGDRLSVILTADHA